MTISEEIQSMAEELERRNLKPEYVVMGKKICIDWLVELSRGDDFQYHKAKKYYFKHGDIPVVVCESEILEVVPNAKFLLDSDI